MPLLAQPEDGSQLLDDAADMLHGGPANSAALNPIHDLGPIHRDVLIHADLYRLE